MVPKKLFFTKGHGTAKERLTSFELALRDARIAALNLVRVTSIYPPGCKIIGREDGLKYLHPGQIAHVVMSDCSTNEPNRLISAAVGLAVPADKTAYGYLSEHHAYGETDEKAADFAEDLAATMLATTQGIDFDPNKAYDERKEIYRMSGRIVRTRNVTQSARGDKNGYWVTVIAAAVLLFE
jgi:arginine decarboxylase